VVARGMPLSTGNTEGGLGRSHSPIGIKLRGFRPQNGKLDLEVRAGLNPDFACWREKRNICLIQKPRRHATSA